MLLTGLGTFYGAVPPEESARQTALGWLLARCPKPKLSQMSWDYAEQRQALVRFGGFNHFVQFVEDNESALSEAQRERLTRLLTPPKTRRRGGDTSSDCLLM